MKMDEIKLSQPKNYSSNWLEFKEKTKMETLIPYYESIQNTGKCRALRKKILQESIDAVCTTRRLCTLRSLWPFCGEKFSNQFLLPKMGLIFPKLIMPEKRIKLFPSKTRKRYKISEINSWYTEAQLNDDELLMFLSEVKGLKKRKYEMWLTLEPDRVEQSREMFIEEDIIGQRMRKYWKTVEKNVRYFQTPKPNKQLFTIVNEALPGSYEYIKNDTEEYVHGSGTVLVFLYNC